MIVSLLEFIMSSRSATKQRHNVKWSLLFQKLRKLDCTALLFFLYIPLSMMAIKGRYALPINTGRIYGCIFTPLNTARTYGPYLGIRIVRVGLKAMRTHLLGAARTPPGCGVSVMLRRYTSPILLAYLLTCLNVTQMPHRNNITSIRQKRIVTVADIHRRVNPYLLIMDVWTVVVMRCVRWKS